MSLGRLLKQLFEISRKFSVKIHPELLLLHKTILTIEGTSYNLNPEINMWKLASPWIKNWAKENLGRKGKILKLKKQQEKFISKIKEMIDIKSTKEKDNDSSLDILKFSLIMLIVNAILFLGLFYDKFLS